MWISTRKAEGPEKDPYIEHYEAHPTDGQTNGPQLYYGLRYHTHIVEPGEVEPSTTKWVIGYGNLKQAIFY